MNAPPPVGSEKTKKDIEALATKLEQARYSFEQYFLGLERVAPLKLRTEVEQLVRHISTSGPIKNTALKFRYDQLVARYNSLSQYWGRVLRQIEDGTYERDLFKLKVHEQERGEIIPEKRTQAGQDLEARLAALPKDGFAAVVRQYLTARQKAGEDVSQVDPQKIRESLKKQAEKISQQFQCKTVQFKVVNEEGKVILKATPKK